MSKSFCVILATALVSVTACKGEFESYNEVSELRVLAIASDKPELVGNEVVVFSALVTEPGASYQWHWCPLPRPLGDGLGCTVDDAEFAQLVQNALGDSIELPELDMGQGETARFTNPFGPQEGRLLCQALVTLAPEDAARPDCLSGTFPFTITLQVTSADAATTVLATRTLGVLLDPLAVPNKNPNFSEVRIGRPGSSDEVIAEDGSTNVGIGESYELVANVSVESAEVFVDETRGEEPVEAREGLVISWFYQTGNIDLGRTSYAENDRPVSQLNTNSWTISDAASIGPTQIWLVLRDTRGGVSWLERELVIGEEQ